MLYSYVPITPAAISKCSAKGDIELLLVLWGRQVSAGSARLVAVGARAVSGRMMVDLVDIGLELYGLSFVFVKFPSVFTPFLSWLDGSGEEVKVAVDILDTGGVRSGVNFYQM